MDDEEDQIINAQTKGNILFTPDDIIRMFPRNESELAKLEIEDEIRKLKVSSEEAVSNATELMKADFKSKITQAVAEIRTLKDAIINSRVDKLPSGNRSFSLNDGKLLDSPVTTSGKSGRLNKKGSFAQSALRLDAASPATRPRSSANLLESSGGSSGGSGGSPITTLTPAFSGNRRSVDKSANNTSSGRISPALLPSTLAPAAPAGSAASSSVEIDQMQQELTQLKGDMGDIKQLLGSILGKLN